MRARGENSRRRADVDRHYLFAVAGIDHRFGFLDQLAKLRLARDTLGVELLGSRARDDADDIAALLCALIDDRFDGAEAVADENEPPVAVPFQEFDRAVKIGDAVIKIFIGGAAELGQIARAGYPVVAAGVDDKTVKA